MSTTTSPAVVQHKPLAPLDLEQTRAAMQTYQQGLQQLLDDSDRQRFERKGEVHEFVKRSGWRKIATWFELSLEIRQIEIDRDPKTGMPIRARVIARAVAPNGRYAEGDGSCDRSERSFSKPEHDIAATATTRATNRAISNLVGMGAVSAEELDGSAAAGAAGYGELGKPADQALIDVVTNELERVLPDAHMHKFVALLAKSSDGAIPEATVRGLKSLAWWLESAGKQAQPEPSTPEGS